MIDLTLGCVVRVGGDTNLSGWAGCGVALEPGQEEVFFVSFLRAVRFGRLVSSTPEKKVNNGFALGGTVCAGGVNVGGGQIGGGEVLEGGMGEGGI